MTINWKLRPLGLLALAAVAAAVTTGTAQARPDPGERLRESSPAGESQRPTGHAEHTWLGSADAVRRPALDGARAAAAGATLPVVVPAAAPDGGFNWLAAGVGGLAAVAALGLAAGAVTARRRGSRLRGAV